MGLEDLVVEGLGCPLGGRHFGLLCDGRRPSRMASIVCLVVNSQPGRKCGGVDDDVLKVICFFAPLASFETRGKEPRAQKQSETGLERLMRYVLSTTYKSFWAMTALAPIPSLSIMETADVRSTALGSGSRNAGWPLELPKGDPPLAVRSRDWQGLTEREFRWGPAVGRWSSTKSTLASHLVMHTAAACEPEHSLLLRPIIFFCLNIDICGIMGLLL